jgi:phospholipid/cholesterol/gamma-HCH transport system substrate-binding protein
VGITGLKLIELTGGSSNADKLNPGSFIETGKSITEDITGKASIISEKVEALLNNLLAITSGPNKNKFISLVDETNTTLKYVNLLLKENINPLNKTFNNLEAFSGELKPLAQNASKALVGLERSISRLDQVSSEIDPRDLKRILRSTGETMEVAKKMIEHLDLTVLKGRSDLLGTLNLLRRSMQNISDVSRMLTEDPSILIRGVNQKGKERR